MASNPILEEIKEITDLGYKEETAIEILKLKELHCIGVSLDSISRDVLNLSGNVEIIEAVMESLVHYVPPHKKGMQGGHFLRICGSVSV